MVKANDIDVPAALIDSEIDVLRRQAAQRFGGNEKQALELPRELFEEQAKRRVVVGLLLGEVIRTNELKADEERVKGLIERDGFCVRRSERSYRVLQQKTKN